MKGNRDPSLLDQKVERIKHNSKSPSTDKVPLNEEDHKSWLEFKMLAERRPVTIKAFELEEGKWPIEVDHPFVLVVGDFAIDTFNEVLEMYVKKEKSNNLRHHQIMACKYLTLHKHYCFFMIMEVIEEGILGVYRAIVGCEASDGCRTLVRFTLMDRRPSGKIAMTLPHLIRLKSRYKTMKRIKRDLEINLKATQKAMEATAVFLGGDLACAGKKNKGDVAAEMIRLKQQYKALKGICKVLYWQIRRQIPKTWNQRSDPDSWSLLNHGSGLLKKRSSDATCIGYDFFSISRDFVLFSRLAY